jgi:hypothetical protein
MELQHQKRDLASKLAGTESQIIPLPCVMKINVRDDVLVALGFLLGSIELSPQF